MSDSTYVVNNISLNKACVLSVEIYEIVTIYNCDVIQPGWESDYFGFSDLLSTTVGLDPVPRQAALP